MLDLGSSFTYPFKNSEQGRSGTKVAIGSLLSLFYILLIPAIVLKGYLCRVTRTTARGADHCMPEWDDWGELLAKGFWLGLAALIYLGLPLALAGVGFGGALYGIATGAEGGSAFTVLAGLGFLAILGSVGFALSLVVTFLLPMVQLNFAMTGRFSSAFNLAGILSGIWAGILDYVLIYLVTLGVGMASGFVISWLIPVAGFFLQFVLQFYLWVVMSHMMGLYYRAHLADSPH